MRLACDVRNPVRCTRRQPSRHLVSPQAEAICRICPGECGERGDKDHLAREPGFLSTVDFSLYLQVPPNSGLPRYNLPDPDNQVPLPLRRIGEQHRFQIERWRDFGASENEVAPFEESRRKSFAMAGGPSRWKRRLIASSDCTPGRRRSTEGEFHLFHTLTSNSFKVHLVATASAFVGRIPEICGQTVYKEDAVMLCYTVYAERSVNPDETTAKAVWFGQNKLAASEVRNRDPTAALCDRDALETFKVLTRTCSYYPSGYILAPPRFLDSEAGR
ncbi:hypothetical protein EK21DRAFT_86995 [Setomelanomma holmii]|uniref:Uncharacterized protein n=1 Tax=Setomelanomma holmii TaxID=210430 RepID=A0A9P4LRD7_9PLEO|nr:hypothetical protein EK21DRAFT_86995 [Setomelanomma holmii]